MESIPSLIQCSDSQVKVIPEDPTFKDWRISQTLEKELQTWELLITCNA